MNGNCSACDIKIDTNNNKKDRTVCKSFYNKNKRKKKTVVFYQQPKVENGNISNNKRPRLVGPIFREEHI